MPHPYGTWESPISAAMASSAVITFQDIVIDKEDIYWSEMRPNEGGRCAIVKFSKGETRDVTPSDFNAYTRVHEYGGASFTVQDGIVYAVNYRDQCLYRFTSQLNQKPVVLTKPGIRFAEFTITPFGMIAIGESHENKSSEPKNFIALVNLETGEVKELASGYDFYSSVSVNKDFTKITWICWNHPNMPWDETQLWVADLDKNGLSNPYQIDSDFTQQSFFQPQWGPHNELVVVSDKSNWWNLYSVIGTELKSLFSVESELGQPLWKFGASTWGFYQDGIVCSFYSNGKMQLFFYKNNTLEPFPIELPYTSFSQLRIHNTLISCIASAPDKPSAILCLEKGKFEVLRENMELNIEPDFLSLPESIAFPSNNRQAYAKFYLPKNKNEAGIKHSKPPLIVKSHGGPTANSSTSLNLEIQYWTSRGFAYVDVDYAGSSGYGRAYRKSLEGNWGIFDVQDCANVANYLAQQGLVDSNKLAITGGSAGGYTTLAALAFTDTFHVGASHYGVSDLAALAQEIHKFESRYLDRLIGLYPQEIAKYKARSPLYHLEKFHAPVIFFQGDEDKVVPPNQAEKMVDALRHKSIEAKYILFKGEAHGFKKAENKIIALEEQRKFFIKMLNLETL
jgi:dipeptidyl aminopeptidase/acylaminoacyl peptidase